MKRGRGGWNITVCSHRMIIFWMGVPQMPSRRYNNNKKAKKSVLPNEVAHESVTCVQTFIDLSLVLILKVTILVIHTLLVYDLQLALRKLGT